MKRHFSRRWVGVVLILVVTLGGCSTIPVLDQVSEPLEVTDTTGHTAQFSGFPDEIAITGRASVMVQDAVFMFDEAEQRVKALENRNQSVYDFLPVVDPDIGEKDLFAMDAGPEQVAPVQPDLLLMKNFHREGLGENIERLGIPVLYLNLETPQIFYRDIDMLGRVFGNPQRAEDIEAFYQTRVDRVMEATGGIPEEQKPRVLLLRYSGQGGKTTFSVPSEKWLQTEMVELAGGKPVWKGAGEGGGWSIVNFEQIAAWDADQIYIIDYRGGAAEVVGDLKGDPLWADLKALKLNQLYAFGFDFYSWDQPDTRWILGLQWLATKIHPDRTSEIDILHEVDRFYSGMYRLEQDTIQSQVLPKIKGDVP